MIPAALVVGLFALRACTATPPLDNLRIVAADPVNDPPGTVAREGSLYIARGGPVIISFQSASPGRLVLGTLGSSSYKQLHGVAPKERIVLPAGPIAIRFAGPPVARLLWSPVGRRGDLEYVPASSLSPEPPERAQFGAGAGAAISDGVISLALLLVLVGTLLMLARHRLREVKRETWLAMGAVFIAACVIRWIGLHAFGQTWDEDVNWSSGRNYVTNILSLDLSPLSWIWNYQHPPVMKYLEGIGAQFADGYGPARALSAIWVALGCAFLVPIGARLYSFRVGVLAAIIAALLPPLVAHGQIVGHEAPTVLWWSLGILLALTIHDGEPSLRTLRIRLVWLGVVIGIAVASRFVNGLLGVLVLVIVAERAPAKRALRTAIEGAAIMPIVAALTLYAVWPRLWTHPFSSLDESLAKLTQPHSPEPFLGAITSTPGPHYFLIYLLATLPLGILAGVIAYCVRAARERNRAALVIAAWFIIPMAVIASPVRQDGVRYVMPCVLALAVAGAAGWDFLVTLLESRVRRAFAIATGVITVYLAITLAIVHPYYLDYFGEQVGGAGTVARNHLFETAWWGEGVGPAVDYVNEHAAKDAKVYRNCIEPAHLAWFREDLWLPMTNDTASADWIVAYSQQSRRCNVPDGFKRVFIVDVQGATLAEVWQR
ncbi:MAG TPA: glycosyltransferase family 39 protein [Kofleriaceae bacterium]|nr:glycosyltransferase family 39 protein [Kofleriaceae bacterium]